MTTLSLTARRLTPSASRPRRAALACGIALLIAAAASAIALFMTRDAAASIPPTEAAALVRATTGTAAMEMQAVGDRAKLVNAAMPFAAGPVHMARPFAASGSDLDQRRALLCLTQTVYYEAGFEPLEGRRAVAQVVLNRMRHPAFPKSVCGVVYQGTGTRVCQFSFVCDGALYRAPAAAAWRQAEAIAAAALRGYVDGTVGSATHYHADYVAPRWAPLLSKVARIGQHIFYRWPGAWGMPAAFSGRYIGEPRDPLSLRPPPPAFGDAIAGANPLAQQDAGPPIPRAPNDVGGLLDTTKGWTLHIPGPDESGGAAKKLIAAQQGKVAPGAEIASAVRAGPVATAR